MKNLKPTLKNVFLLLLFMAAAKVNALPIFACPCVPVMNVNSFNAAHRGCLGGIQVLINGCFSIAGNGSLHSDEGYFGDIPLVPNGQLNFPVPAGHYTLTFNYNSFNQCGAPGLPAQGQLQQNVTITEPGCDLSIDDIDVTDASSPNSIDGSISIFVSGNSCSGTGQIDFTNEQTSATSTSNIADNGVLIVNNLDTGNYTISYYYEDWNGLTVCSQLGFAHVGFECTASLTNCPSNIVVYTSEDECARNVTWTEPSFSSSCDYSTYRSHAPNSIFNVANGPTTVTYIYTTEDNVEHICTFTVTLLDTLKPRFTGCPGNINSNTAIVSWTPPVLADTCADTLWSNHYPGETFSVGATVVTYIGKNKYNNKTDTCRFTITVGCSYTAKPATPGAISGTTTVCPGTYTYSISAVTNATSYTWAVPANASITSGQGTTSVHVQFTSSYVTGSITVLASNCKGNSAAKTLTVKMTVKPGVPLAITGSKTACAGDIVTYSIAAVAGATSYNWTAPANAQVNSGQGTTSATIEYLSGFSSGTVSVNAYNCGGTSNARALAVNTTLAAVGTITGTIYEACKNSTQTYSIAAIAGASSYNWVVTGATLASGQGSTSIQVTFPSNYTGVAIKVQAVSSCNSTAFKSITVYPGVTIGALTGATTGWCGGATGVSFSIPAIATATYTWGVPSGITLVSGQGTNAIVVDIAAGFTSGNLTVYASNACGNGAVKSFALSSIPAVPGAITGTSPVCAGTNYTYTIPSVASATSYTWTIPAGWSVVSGQGSTALTVTAGSTAGYLKVTANNACGSSAVKQKNITMSTSCGSAKTDETTGIETSAETETNVFALYPNPTNGNFNIKINSVNEGGGLIQIFDLAGRIVEERNVSVTTGENNFSFNMNERAPGMYVVKILAADETKTIQLIRQ